MFFVQEDFKEPWHVESDGNCEVMLCGKIISVNSMTARIRATWGQRRCPDCWVETERLQRIKELLPTRAASSRSSRSRTSPTRSEPSQTTPIYGRMRTGGRS